MISKNYLYFSKRNSRRRNLRDETTKEIDEGIWKCKKEDLSSLIKCKTNKACPCGEFCNLKIKRCKRATCNKEATGGKIKYDYF